MHSDHSEIKTWLDTNEMKMNVKKMKYIFFQKCRLRTEFQYER